MSFWRKINGEGLAPGDLWANAAVSLPSLEVLPLYPRSRLDTSGHGRMAGSLEEQGTDAHPGGLSEQSPTPGARPPASAHPTVLGGVGRVTCPSVAPVGPLLNGSWGAAPAF